MGLAGKVKNDPSMMSHVTTVTAPPPPYETAYPEGNWNQAASASQVQTQLDVGNRTLTGSVSLLEGKLRSIVEQNGLQYFYKAPCFDKVLKLVQSIDFGSIASRWKISRELAYDLAPLALYDIVFYCDDSGSMAFEEDGERIEDLKYILSKVSEIATMFDDDGILVRFMNSDTRGDGIRNANDAQSLVDNVRFSGMTPLGTNLERKVLQPFVNVPALQHSMAKPVLVVCITDGEPSGEPHDTIVHVIRRSKDILDHSPYGKGALAVQIAQVGKDSKTQRFLARLDNDVTAGAMIDCTSYFEMEAEEWERKGVTLTPELWLLKMCVGAIDRSYDSQDD
jgi:hypothetical protein